MSDLKDLRRAAGGVLLPLPVPIKSRRFRGMAEMMRADQARAARALLRWTVRKAAGEIGISTRTLSRFETGQSQPGRGTLLLIRQTYEQHGVEFDVGNGGVRLKA